MNPKNQFSGNEREEMVKEVLYHPVKMSLLCRKWCVFILKRDKCRKTHDNQSSAGKKTKENKG